MDKFTSESSEQTAAVSAAWCVMQTGQRQQTLLLNTFPHHLPGLKFLNRKLKVEINVLKKGLSRHNWVKMEHVASSNLHQLGAVVELAAALGEQVDALLQKYRDTAGAPYYMDIVAAGARLWIKVVCRCPNTLQLGHLTGGRPGEHPPLEQARALLLLANSYPVLYKAPQVAFVFCKGVSVGVAEALRGQGVLVFAPIFIPDDRLSASLYDMESFNEDGEFRLSDFDESDDDDVIINTSAAAPAVAATADATVAVTFADAAADAVAADAAAVAAAAADAAADTDAVASDAVASDAPLTDAAVATKPKWLICSDEEIVKIAEEIKNCLKLNNENVSQFIQSQTQFKVPINISTSLVPNRPCDAIDRNLERLEPVNNPNPPMEVDNQSCLDNGSSFISNETATSNSSLEITSTIPCNNNNSTNKDIGPQARLSSLSPAAAPPVTPTSVLHSSATSPLASATSRLASATSPLASATSRLASATSRLASATSRLPSATSPPVPLQQRLVCLDVPTLIAYVSNISNGDCHLEFQGDFLRAQAEWERQTPIKEVIDKFCEGAAALVCREARSRFEKIVQLVGGPQEKRRAGELLLGVQTVPDRDDLVDLVTLCGGITDHSRIIFGTALHHTAPLVTANTRFVRSAASQGVGVAALLHKPRALSELKEGRPAPHQAACTASRDARGDDTRGD